MRYRKRFTWKTAARSPILLVLLLIIFTILARSAWKVHQKAEHSANRLAQVEAELKKLTERQRELSEKVGYLSTTEGLEAEIRTKYHAVKHGESVAVIIDDNKAAVATASSTDEAGFWSKILRIFGIGE